MPNGPSRVLHIDDYRRVMARRTAKEEFKKNQPANKTLVHKGESGKKARAGAGDGAVVTWRVVAGPAGGALPADAPEPHERVHMTVAAGDEPADPAETPYVRELKKQLRYMSQGERCNALMDAGMVLEIGLHEVVKSTTLVDDKTGMVKIQHHGEVRGVPAAAYTPATLAQAAGPGAPPVTAAGRLRLRQAWPDDLPEVGACGAAAAAPGTWVDFEAGIDEAFMCEGLVMALKDVKAGESVTVEVMGEYLAADVPASFGTLKELKRLEATFEVELLRAFHPEAPAGAAAADAAAQDDALLARAEELRLRGNALFKEKRARRAEVVYERAAACLVSKEPAPEAPKPKKPKKAPIGPLSNIAEIDDDDEPAPPPAPAPEAEEPKAAVDAEAEKRRDAARLAVHNNLGLCKQTRGAYREALTHYRKVRAIDGEHAKAAFRSAKCYIELGEVNLAKQWLARAEDADPSNREILRERARLDKVTNKAKARAHAMFSPEAFAALDEKGDQEGEDSGRMYEDKHMEMLRRKAPTLLDLKTAPRPPARNPFEPRNEPAIVEDDLQTQFDEEVKAQKGRQQVVDCIQRSWEYKEKMKGMGIDMDDETGDSMLEYFAQIGKPGQKNPKLSDPLNGMTMDELKTLVPALAQRDGDKPKAYNSGS